MLIAIALAALLQGPAAAPAATPQDSASAYLDPGAAALLRGARERRARVERSIDRYQVTARERVNAGLTAASRERTLFGRETAVRIQWQRGQTGVVRVLGAREASPSTSRGITVPEDLQSEVTSLAFDPDELQLNLFQFGAGSQGEDPDEEDDDDDPADARVRRDSAGTEVNLRVGEPLDPLRPGSEAHYRFRSGDTSSVRLPDGSQLRLIQLEVIPRRREFELLRGTLWIDEQTKGVVRSVLTTARPFDLRRDTGDDVPRVLNTFGAIQAEVRYVTVEYALFQGRFWLPRLVAIDAEANLGVLAGIPVRYERSYSDYEVQAAAVPERAPITVLAQQRVDSTAARVCRDEAKAAGETCDCSNDRCRRWRVEVPADSAALLASPDLPPPLADGNARLITGEEVESLARVLDPSIGSMGDFAPELTMRWTALRYNRVEALSMGARADVAWGPLAADGQLRVGTGDREVSAELGIARESLARRTRLGGYRRLATFDPGSRALSLSGSLNALVLGRDEADYIRASGAELTSEPVRFGRWMYAWRLFGEHQHPVSRTTQLTLARAWDEEPFRGVRPADRADQAGASLALARTFGGDRSPARLTLGTWAEGQAGTFGFGRGQVTARMGAPSLGRFALALEAAAGTSAGDVPLQGLWYLGGTTTVRGYEGALLGGESFWRARAEVATPLPAARLVLFSDAGWAGPRDGWDFDPPLLSAGVGASVLDGLIRLDVSRALRSPTGWRVDLYLDGSL
ncbi:MAG TPA: BamA/TamA family outer membrane protein [Longimicrobium sp.]|nr:BamA/TamA family outer membrane protein [Longimicrobium sp.]